MVMTCMVATGASGEPTTTGNCGSGTGADAAKILEAALGGTGADGDDPSKAKTPKRTPGAGL